MLANETRSALVPQASALRKPWGMEPNVFCMVMHLSQLTSFFLPLIGIVFPIIMWTTEKEHNNDVDVHGRVIINWMISSIIYALISGLLCLILIGIPMLIALVIVSIVFTIMGAVKANDGQIWSYPMSITFLALPKPTTSDVSDAELDDNVAPPFRRD